MNASILKEGSNSNWVSGVAGAIAGSLMTGIITFIINGHSIDTQAQASTLREVAIELRDHDQRITMQGADELRLRADIDRHEKTFSDLQKSNGEILEALTRLKDASDETKSEVQSLADQFSHLRELTRPDQPHPR